MTFWKKIYTTNSYIFNIYIQMYLLPLIFHNLFIFNFIEWLQRIKTFPMTLIKTHKLKKDPEKRSKRTSQTTATPPSTAYPTNCLLMRKRLLKDKNRQLKSPAFPIFSTQTFVRGNKSQEWYFLPLKRKTLQTSLMKWLKNFIKREMKLFGRRETKTTWIRSFLRKLWESPKKNLAKNIR